MQPNFDALYRAVVTANTDPSGARKIKVQCPQIAGMAEVRSAEPVNPSMPVPSVGTIVWVGFSGGDITKPFYLTNLSYLYVNSDGTSLQAVSLISGVNNDATQLFLVSGPGANPTGTTNPHMSLRDTNNTAPVDLHLSGNVIKTTNDGTYVTWSSPTFQPGWAVGTGVGGSFPNLKWRLTAEDEVHIHGTFHATSASPGPVVANGFPAVNIGGNVGMAGVATKINTTTSTTITCYVNSSGELRTSGLPTIANTDTFAMNIKVPLGNLI